MPTPPASRRNSQVSGQPSTARRSSKESTSKPSPQRRQSNVSVRSSSSTASGRMASIESLAKPAVSATIEEPITVLSETYYLYNKKRNLLIQPSPQDFTFAASLPSVAGTAEVSFKVGLSLGSCPFVSEELLNRLPKGHKVFVETELHQGDENIRHPFGNDVEILGKTVLPIILRDVSTGKKFKLEPCAIVLDRMPLPLYINRSHPAIQKIVHGGAKGQLLPWRFDFGGPMYFVPLSGGGQAT